jgi:aspartate carbamoyltransferase catalytic subunit
VHLLGIDTLSRVAIVRLLDRADTHFHAAREARVSRSSNAAGAASLPLTRSLAGRSVVNLFFEASTRTRVSFEVAAKRLGADVVNVAAQASSVSKGETLLDTVKNLAAMGSDVLVMRHPAAGAPHFVAERTPLRVVNAGDGAHEHPTQALLDAFTLRRHRGRLEGLTVAICGDILHSRVARSNALLLGKMGAKVRFAAPRTLLPRGAEKLTAERLERGADGSPDVPDVEIFDDLDAAMRGADAVMLLRIQSERLASLSMVPSTAEYARTFGLSVARAARLPDDVLVMHPGPINRGVELAGAVADGARSVVLEQVEAGVAVRMAVLESLFDDAGAGESGPGSDAA